MAATTTIVRHAIRDALAAALTLDFVDGKIDGPLRDVTIGCIWPDSGVPVEQDANYVAFGMVARILLALDPHASELDPDDPESLETMEQAAIISVSQAASGGGSLEGYFVQYHGSTYDVDGNQVDLMFSAQIPNPYDPA